MAYDPNQNEKIILKDGVISLNSLDDIDAAWSATKDALEADDRDPGNVADHFEPAFTNLQETAWRLVDLNHVTQSGPSILSKMSERVDRQLIRALRDALVLLAPAGA